MDQTQTPADTAPADAAPADATAALAATAPAQDDPQAAMIAPAPEAATEAPGKPLAGDVPPDRLAIHPGSAHFDQDVLMRGVGIRFKGTQRRNVEEYSISEGWIRVQAGKTMDRRGQPLTLKLTGPVEAWFEDLGEDAPVAKV